MAESMIPQSVEQVPAPVVPTKQVEQTTVAGTGETTYSETELQAMSMGWRPQDQWEGDEEKWIPAKEFVQRKSLFDKIDSQSRQIKDLQKTMQTFKQHYEQVNEAAYQRAIQTLKAQKRQALEEEDTKAALQIEDRIDAVQEEWHNRQQQQVQQTQTYQPSETFVGWLKQNQWYATDGELNGVADGIGVNFYKRHPGVSENEVLDHVAKEIRKRYPDRFPRNAARSAPSPVDGSTQRSGNAQRGPKLPPEAEETMNRLVKAGVMTKEQYMKDWTAVNKGE